MNQLLEMSNLRLNILYRFAYDEFIARRQCNNCVR
jgi:hypothetical protein